MRKFIILVLILQFGCNTLNYTQKQNSITTQKRNIAIHIGYNFQNKGKILDLNFFDNTTNSLFFDYYYLTLALNRTKLFTQIDIDSSDSEYELEIFLNEHDNSSHNYLISLFTFHIFPYYTEKTIQLEGIFTDRKNGKKSEKKIILANMKIYHGIFPYVVNTFASNEKKIDFYKSMLTDLINELKI
ncbi:hypothetical protein [Leptospira harrisiae]|uniref:hypothetical protein n=1 Tax=Leptospira harrisiae TaxID=2023189 RepID=UPI000C2A8343|nr:hypothetical protein [Leptospira harrisiae]PKA06504.1 hypothetical protein CH366_18850 [Leptospira harrisiae]